MRTFSRFIVAGLLSLNACADSPFDALYDDDFSFKASPVALGDLYAVIPVGNMNPPSHTVPTAHMYFYHSSTSPRLGLAVYAPANGLVTSVRPAQDGESKIWVKCAAGFEYFMDHVVLDSSVHVGTRFSAGEKIGSTSGKAYAVDLGLTNFSRKNAGLIQPDRYASEVLMADLPLNFFDSPTSSSLVAFNVRTSTDKAGKFDYDQSGRMVGNWFEDGVPVSEDATKGETAGTRHLSVVYSVKNPSRVVISVGGGLTTKGVYLTQNGSPDPAGITVQSGIQFYQLYVNTGNIITETPSGTQFGLMMLQLENESTLRAEFLSGTVSSGSFSQNSKIYRR